MKKIILICLILSPALSQSQWEKMPNGMKPYSTVYSLTANGNTIFAGAGGQYGTPGIFTSTNNGTNWISSGLTYINVFEFAVNGNNIFAGTGGYGVYLSTNNGASWAQTSFNNQTVYSLAIAGNNVFAGVDGNGVYISANNGTSWVQTPLINHTVSSLAINGNSIFAGTFYVNGIYLSTNSGTSWTQTSLNNQNVSSLAANGNNIFAGTWSNGVYLSTNNGTTWTQTSLNNQNVQALIVNGNNIFAGTNGNGVYVTMNNGASWIQRNEGLFPFVTSFCILNNYIFAGTINNTVFRRPLSELTGITPISNEVPSKFSLYQNYPNPFNPSTVIRFQVAWDKFVKLIVYDAQGKEVSVLVNEQLKPGVYEVNFDGVNFTSGIYFYKLSN